MSEYKIEKGVSLPMMGNSLSKAIYPFNDMEIGDSFKVGPTEIKKTRASSNNYGKRHGQKYTTRKMPDGTARCWRIA